MKPIKPGTRFAVRVGDQWESKGTEPMELGTRDARWSSDRRAPAYDLADDHIAAGRSADVVRLIPRTDHKAEAERLRAAIRAALNYARAHVPLQVIDVLAEALRDPGEPGKGAR